MESNDQLTNTDESENHSGQTEMTEQSTIEPEVKTEIIKEIKTEVVPVEWVVGYFENENLYSVIPSNWLLNVNDSWYSKWPNSSIKSAVQTRIINAVEPAKTWKYYPVEVIKRYNSYHEAEQETFSCLSVVDQDSLGRGKRKKKSNFRHFDLSGDSDNESCVSMKIKGGPKKVKRKPLNHDSKNAASSSNDLENHQESCSSQNSSTNIQNNSKIYFEGSNSNTSTVFTRKKKKNLKKEDDKCMSLIFGCIDRIDKNLNELGKELIKRKVAAITQKTLKELQEESSINIKQKLMIKIKKEPLDELDTTDEKEIDENALDCAFLSNFPMTELDDIINMELKLLNCPNFNEKFVLYLTSIGGVDIKNFVKRILSRVFTNRLATLCTWRGYHGNFELQRLYMIKTMCDVSKSIYGNSVQTEFEEYVKEWFRRGKQRYSRQINTVRAKTTA